MNAELSRMVSVQHVETEICCRPACNSVESFTLEHRQAILS